MNRSDLLLVVLLAAGIGALAAQLWVARSAASHVEIRVGGQVWGRHPLHTPQRLEVPGARGISVLEIQAGRVRFVDSPCRNRVCVHSGWLAYGGGAAACLPNRVSLTLSGGDAEVDGVSH
jgi:hypothetical protein